jgi:hypothetical protein
MTKTKKNVFKELKFKGKYQEFKDFYDENKETIYRSIIELFKEFTKSRKKYLTLYISAKIQGLEWDTEFNFNKGESIILKRDLMPYFEDIEDYETCGDLISLHKELTL